MPDIPPANSPASAPASAPVTTYAEVERALLGRWPESRLEPTLARIRQLTGVLGDPQRAYPVIHLTGTNGKTSTARMIDSLLRVLGLRTGRFTSPHLESMTERICIDGEPLTEERFVAAYRDVEPYVRLVDAAEQQAGGSRLSFFETMVGMAYAAFADAPVEVAVVEVGMGGAWDATNVADGQVAVVLPIGVDHAGYLGETPEEIAHEKAGILKPGAIAVLATQTAGAALVLHDKAQAVGATLAREGLEFAVRHRLPGVGGQLLTLQGLRGEYDEVFLPLSGAHQAQNAAVALAAVEAFVGGGQALDPEAVQEGLGRITSPGRLELIRRSPPIVLDAAHNPHGAAATAAALQESFTFSPLIGVVAVMADKDYDGLLSAFEPELAAVVCTQNSSDRALPAEELAEAARGVFGVDRVHMAARLDDALDMAATLAEAGGTYGEALGSGGVLVTGSVVTVGEARAMLAPRRAGGR